MHLYWVCILYESGECNTSGVGSWLWKWLSIGCAGEVDGENAFLIIRSANSARSIFAALKGMNANVQIIFVFYGE